MGRFVMFQLDESQEQATCQNVLQRKKKTSHMSTNLC